VTVFLLAVMLMPLGLKQAKPYWIFNADFRFRCAQA